MHKVADNKLSTLKTFFFKELSAVLGKRETKLHFEICAQEWLGLSKVDLIVNSHVHLSESQILRFLYAIKDFKNQQPLAHVIGKTFFYGLEIVVSPETLIPRPETEELVSLVIERSSNAGSILDVGTGSGCIALALKSRIKGAFVQGVDVSESALLVAQKNAQILNLEVNFLKLDILKVSDELVVGKNWEVIVSNPPYIPNQERLEMAANVVGKDPDIALFVPDHDPLLFYQKIGQLALRNLTENGKLYFEIHEKYGIQTQLLLKNIGFTKVELIKDLQAKDRMIVAQI